MKIKIKITHGKTTCINNFLKQNKALKTQGKCIFIIKLGQGR